MFNRFLLTCSLLVAVFTQVQGICKSQHCKELPTEFNVVASGLRNPQGFAIARNGTIYIAQSGLTITPPPPPPFAITETGRISQVLCNGQIKVISDHLFGLQGSVEGVTQENSGIVSVALLKGTLYALVNFGPASGLLPLPQSISGVYRVDLATGSLTLIADINAFDVANCPSTNPNCQCPPNCPVFSSPFDMIAWQDKLYVTNGHTDTINEVDPALPLGSNIRRFAEFSQVVPGEPHPVLTGINVSPRGEFLYVVQLTPFSSNPQPPNSARVWRISKSGGGIEIEQVAQGYNFGQGVAVDRDGSIYVTQFTQQITTEGVYIGEGSLVRWNPKTEVFETILPNLTLPGAIHISGDTLYLSNYTQLGSFVKGS